MENEIKIVLLSYHLKEIIFVLEEKRRKSDYTLCLSTHVCDENNQ